MRLSSVISIVLFLLFSVQSHGVMMADVVRWQPGHEIPASMLNRIDMDDYFVAMPIDSIVFGRIKGKSYKKNCTVARQELRYLKLLHVNKEGKVMMGEIVCNKAIASDLIQVFKQLYEARYPIERMVLIDEYDADDEASMAANNTSCFNYRTVAGTKKLSKHSMGMAVDINPLYNPYVRQVDGKEVVSPSGGKAYKDRNKHFDYKITSGDLCHRLFLEHGFRWGGSWRTMKDYQHFELDI